MTQVTEINWWAKRVQVILCVCVCVCVCVCLCKREMLFVANNNICFYVLLPGEGTDGDIEIACSESTDANKTKAFPNKSKINSRKPTQPRKYQTRSSGRVLPLSKGLCKGLSLFSDSE